MVLEDTDVAKALVEYISQMAIETLVIGGSSNKGFLRLVSLHCYVGIGSN